jgi:hypothetical protein
MSNIFIIQLFKKLKITDACISESQEIINTHLEAGWKLQGSVCMSITSDHRVVYMSASQMVILEKSWCGKEFKNPRMFMEKY